MKLKWQSLALILFFSLASCGPGYEKSLLTVGVDSQDSLKSRSRQSGAMDANQISGVGVSFTSISGSGNLIQDGELKFYNIGAATGAVNLPQSSDGLYRVAFYARGDMFSGLTPRANVFIDDLLVGTIRVSSTSSSYYEITDVQAGAGQHRVIIAYNNDVYRSSSEDLNLFVQSVSISPMSGMPAVSTSCQVTVQSCPAHPEVAYQTINDTWDGSAENQGRCLARAGEYSTWCLSTDPVTATYYQNGVATASNTAQPNISPAPAPEPSPTPQPTPAPSASTACIVEVKSCPEYPEVAYQTINDTWDGSAENQGRCLARAGEYSTWCLSTDPVTAIYYQNGVATASYTVQPSASPTPPPPSPTPQPSPAPTVSTACMVEVKSCPVHPEVGYQTINDTWDGAANDQGRCLARAGEYSLWCLTADPVTATFYQNGVATSSNTYQPSASPTPPPQSQGGGTLAVNVVVLSSKNPSLAGQNVKFVAAVAPAVSNLTFPTGLVTFSFDGVDQGSAQLKDGSAEYTLASLPAGSHTMAVRYSGDANYAASVSTIISQTVNASFSRPWQAGIDVTKYGLKGDGVTDNTAAFQALLANLPNDRGGGQMLYFPAGTYLVSQTIDLAKASVISLVGDVDENGAPASTIKANHISTPFTTGVADIRSTPDQPWSAWTTYYPMLRKDGNGIGGTGPLHIFNLRLIAPDDPMAVAVFISGMMDPTFENLEVSGYYGIISWDATFMASFRKIRFIGHSVPKSIGLVFVQGVVDECYFSGWEHGARIQNSNSSIIRSTFEKNVIGLWTGGSPFPGTQIDANLDWNAASSLNDLVIRDNDIGIYANDGANTYSNVDITGSAAAPSGQSQIGLRMANVSNNSYIGLKISGSFSRAAAVHDGGGSGLTFYASQVTNSYPSAPVWSYYNNDWADYSFNVCPANSRCIYTYQPNYVQATMACASGTIKVLSSEYLYAAGKGDCTAYVASQCNGKAVCSITYSAGNCAVNVGGDTNTQYGNATLACVGNTPNPTPQGARSVSMNSATLPHYIADADNVTASHLVPSTQPTVGNSSMLLDVTKHGIVPDFYTDNTAAIQALIDKAANGTIFYFPQGNYRIASQLDFSRLKNFSIFGDGEGSGGDARGTYIIGGLKMDYGTGAGSFQIRNLNVGWIYARNAVLSNIQGVQGYMILDNPFMVSLRSIAYNMVEVNGGMRATVEALNGSAGFEKGITMYGVNHSLFASRFEVFTKAAITLGADRAGNPKPMIGASVAGMEMEANSIAVNVVSCRFCSISSILAYGHQLDLPTGMEPDNHGFYIDDVHDSVFSADGAVGFFFISSATVTGKASNILFTDSWMQNHWSDGSSPWSPNAKTWIIDPAASGLIFNAVRTD